MRLLGDEHLGDTAQREDHTVMFRKGDVRRINEREIKREGLEVSEVVVVVHEGALSPGVVVAVHLQGPKEHRF